VPSDFVIVRPLQDSIRGQLGAVIADRQCDSGCGCDRGHGGRGELRRSIRGDECSND
jgi:hypothetical protein